VRAAGGRCTAGRRHRRYSAGDDEGCGAARGRDLGNRPALPS
jgi:hypothetical protein